MHLYTYRLLENRFGCALPYRGQNYPISPNTQP
jgi:hypothetical protein